MSSQSATERAATSMPECASLLTGQPTITARLSSATMYIPIERLWTGDRLSSGFPRNITPPVRQQSSNKQRLSTVTASMFAKTAPSCTQPFAPIRPPPARDASNHGYIYASPTASCAVSRRLQACITRGLSAGKVTAIMLSRCNDRDSTTGLS